MTRPRYNLALAGLGFELAASVVGLTLLGLWIDRRWQTAPWGLLIGATIGFVGGMYNFIRAAQKAARRAAGEAGGRAADRGRKSDR